MCKPLWLLLGKLAGLLSCWCMYRNCCDAGTDLEDVACLPGISDFRPGVYHMPEGAQQCDLSIDDDWPVAQQQPQPQQQPHAAMDSACVEGSSDSKCATNWTAQVCLRSQQQLSGRVSVSNWLDDDETGAACDALCAFAVPAMPPSCGSTNGSADAADEAAASCHSMAGEGSQAGSACSEDSRPSSRQSSNTTAGFSSSGAIGGPLAESSSMGSGCLAAAVDAAAVAQPVEWDTSLHLPLWVSGHERDAIEAKLDGWVERLLEVGADVRGLAGELIRSQQGQVACNASCCHHGRHAMLLSRPAGRCCCMKTTCTVHLSVDKDIAAYVFVLLFVSLQLC